MTYGSAEVLVVKLGGSLAGSTELAGWLRALEAAAMPVVIVPGGGPFAEAVRVAQPKIGFDDVAAHEMAMLGMTQFGVALASLCAKAVVASSEVNISAALAQGLLPVWSPGAMALAAADIPASWDITSDSLAAWLAGRIGAGRLLLVKQVNAGGCEADLQAPATVDAGADLRESHISSILKIGRFLPPPCGEVGAKRRVGGAKGGYLARLSALLVQTAQKFRP